MITLEKTPHTLSREVYIYRIYIEFFILNHYRNFNHASKMPREETVNIQNATVAVIKRVYHIRSRN